MVMNGIERQMGITGEATRGGAENAKYCKGATPETTGDRASKNATRTVQYVGTVQIPASRTTIVPDATQTYTPKD